LDEALAAEEEDMISIKRSLNNTFCKMHVVLLQVKKAYQFYAFF
jgi:hypothetical protein